MDFFAPLGFGTGGSANLYAAQLERMLPVDFSPKKNYPSIKDSTLPAEWPVDYESFIPYYRKAEVLFRVRGEQDFFNPDLKASYLNPPLMDQETKKTFKIFADLKLHPYRAHVASEFIKDCDGCGGKICFNHCKNDAFKIALLPALKKHGAKIMTESEVVYLKADRKKVTHVVCSQKNKELQLKGKIIILAAGSLFSPVILLASKSKYWPKGLANSSDYVGRNLMWHASDFFGVFPLKSSSNVGHAKELSLNDFYFNNDIKLGNIQSVGVPINSKYVSSYLSSLSQNKSKLFKLILQPFVIALIAYTSSLLARYFKLYTTIIEDLPYWENRVFYDPKAKNNMRFNYNYSDELSVRTKIFRKKIKNTFGKKFFTFFITGKDNINYGHPSGTCRFGNDPKTSVLNKNNRCHDVENLYVIDASFFPSSSGVNPSLTIAANALRVAPCINNHLKKL
jgi:choline dehydrogenase-like flavoprotein